MTPPDYKELAQEVWNKLDATPGGSKLEKDILATALTQADALGYARGRGELDKLLDLLRREEFDAVAEMYSRALTAEPAKPCGYCVCGHASADHFFDKPHACNYGHPCRCEGFEEPKP